MSVRSGQRLRQDGARGNRPDGAVQYMVSVANSY